MHASKASVEEGALLRETVVMELFHKAAKSVGLLALMMAIKKWWW